VEDPSHDRLVPNIALRYTKPEYSDRTPTRVQIEGEVGVSAMRDAGVEALHRSLKGDNPTIRHDRIEGQSSWRTASPRLHVEQCRNDKDSDRQPKSADD